MKTTTDGASGYKVFYLGHLARRALVGSRITLDAAIKDLRAYKRCGYTVWIETVDGIFVPVKGATRKPAERVD